MDRTATCPFDHHSARFATDGKNIEAELRSRGPVVWSTMYGGFWAVVGHDELNACLRDPDLVSSAPIPGPDGSPVTGILIPPAREGVRFLPGESDRPMWDVFRNPLNPLLSPAAVARRSDRIQGFTTALVNRVIARGDCDFVVDIAFPLTGLVTLDLIGLPLSDYEFYSWVFHRIPHDKGEETMAGMAEVKRRLHDTVREHRDRPTETLVDKLIAVQWEGAPATDEQVVSVIMQVIGGGFDTVSSLLSNAMIHLTKHPELRGELLADDMLLQTATEEFLRTTAPQITLARTAKKDFELGGQQIRAGDRVLIMYRSANHDERAFENPAAFDPRRMPNPHFAFGSGIHRCAGSNLARLEFKIVLREILKRLPDFSVVLSEVRTPEDCATGVGYLSVPVRFTPGPPVPVPEDDVLVHASV